MRQRAILRAQDGDERTDEDDWKMRYPALSVGWLVDILESVDYRWSPVQILETESFYPGLIDDISTEIWQRRLIKAQMNKSE